MKISTLTRSRQTLLILSSFILIIGISIFLTQPTTNAETNKNNIATNKTSKNVDTSEEHQPKQVKASRNYKIEQDNVTHMISGPELDKHLKGNLKGLGSDFVKTGKSHNIDPVFLAALAAQETGWGNSTISESPWNNIGGITCMPGIYKDVFGEEYPNPGCEEFVEGGTSWQKFLSIEDSIRFKAVYLKEYYLENGKETIGEIQKTYAPNQAANDQSGLNNHWVKNIVAIMNDVKENQNL